MVTIAFIQYGAFRAKLLTVDGNHIDSVFVDKRGSPDVLANGNKLVSGWTIIND